MQTKIDQAESKAQIIREGYIPFREIYISSEREFGRRTGTFNSKGQLISALRGIGITDFKLAYNRSEEEEFTEYKKDQFAMPRLIYLVQAFIKLPKLPAYFLRMASEKTFILDKKDHSGEYSAKIGMRPGFGTVESIRLDLGRKVFLTRGVVRDIAESAVFAVETAEIHDAEEFENETSYLSSFGPYRKRTPQQLEAEKVKDLFNRKDFGKREISSMTDEEVVMRYRTGDKKVFEELYLRSLPTILGLAREFHFRAYEKDDLIQEGALSLIAAIRDYDGRNISSFRHFLRTVFRHDLLDLDDSRFEKGAVFPKYSLDTRVGEEKLEDAIVKVWHRWRRAGQNGHTAIEQIGL